MKPPIVEIQWFRHFPGARCWNNWVGLDFRWFKIQAKKKATTKTMIHNTTQPGKEKDRRRVWGACYESSLDIQRKAEGTGSWLQLLGMNFWGHQDELLRPPEDRFIFRPTGIPNLTLPLTRRFSWENIKWLEEISYQPRVTWWFMLVVSLLSQESVTKGIIITGFT